MEIFKILGKISIEGAETANKALESVGNVAKKAGKVIAAGLAAGATAVAAVSKAALDSYADYEQLVGGVQTLFGLQGQSLEEYAATVGKTTDEALDEWLKYTTGERKILNNAEQAYKTAGLSMNQYMETVTSFSASLIQSLGGDTAKAADYADMAVTDMADNANKMGTSIEMIQTAYAGFAKQNYTMLDNLKLGYGGTQEEMIRLLKDADALSDTFNLLEDENGDLVFSYADVVDAIHIVQEEMGIAGATAAEAATTIQGSMAMTKSAWQNLLTGFGDENADLGALVDNLVESALTAFGNIMPRIEQILKGISTAVEKIMPVIAAELPSLLEQLLPGLIDGALALVVGLVQALPMLIEVLAAQIPTIVSQLATALAAAWPALCDAVVALMGALWDVVKMGAGAAWDWIKGIWESVTAWFDEKIVQPISDLFTSLWEGVKTAFKTPINWIIDGINAFIRGINKVKIPDWVPLVGGKGFTIPELPKLEKGGVLERGQMGLLEGNGAEAVVPLDQNRAWISAVAKDMSAAVSGDDERLQKIIDLLERLIDTLPETMIAAFASMKFDVNNREFARLVKAVG